jgi:hypothetical protein
MIPIAAHARISNPFERLSECSLAGSKPVVSVNL